MFRGPRLFPLLPLFLQFLAAMAAEGKVRLDGLAAVRAVHAAFGRGGIRAFHIILPVEILVEQIRLFIPVGDVDHRRTVFGFEIIQLINAGACCNDQPKDAKGGMYCPYCGKPIQADFAFCSHCGKELKK